MGSGVMLPSTIVRLVHKAGGEFRILDGNLQVRRIPAHLRPMIHEQREELRDYLLLCLSFDARCRRCGAQPAYRLSDNHLCWRCQLSALG